MTYKVGVIGSSFGGAVHVPAFRAQGNFEVVAIASPANARRVAAERRIPQAFTSWQEMLESADIDVVSVATPPFEHRAAVLAALARGKHVLCEKPFGLNVAEAEEMLQAARAAGTVSALAHEFRYLPTRFAIAELIENGHLGPLREIEFASFASNLRESGTRPNSWWFDFARGGGLAGAMLSHVIDTAIWLAGRPPVRSVGLSRTANPVRTAAGETFTSDVADGAFALLDFGQGLVANLGVDGTHATDSSVLAVHGERRTAVASGPSILDETLFAVDGEETAELELLPDPYAKLASVHRNVPAFVHLLDRFVARLEGGTASLPTFGDGLATQRVLEAAGYSTPSTGA